MKQKAFFQKRRANSFILFLCIFLFLVCSVLTLLFIEQDIYSSTLDEQLGYIYHSQIETTNNQLFSNLQSNNIFQDNWMETIRENLPAFLADDSSCPLLEGYGCEISISTQNPITTITSYTYDPDKMIKAQSYAAQQYSSFYKYIYTNTYGKPVLVEITGYINGINSLDNTFYKYALFLQFAFVLRYPVLFALLLCGIFIFVSARNLVLYYRKFQAPVTGAARIPMEMVLFLFVSVNLLVVSAAHFLTFDYPMDSRLLLQIILAFLLLVVWAFAIYRLLITIFRRLGNHTLRSTCLLLIWPAKALRGFWRHMSRFSLTFRGLLLYCIIVCLEIFFFRPFYYAHGTAPMVLIIAHIAFFCVLWYLLFNIQRMQEGVEEITRGENLRPFDGKKIYGAFRQLADSITDLGTGLTHAVQEQIKSEHLKTELITNVSHDIKTPLTSIINYVDLLKKESLDNEKATEYIEVLERHSLRLKRLISDLIEASKATTGNIEMHLQKCQINVLLEQLLGEYADRMEEKKLTPVADLPHESVYVMADGQYLWRCMDNLMINICKYSLERTRVYLSLEVCNGQAVVTFKNISQSPLNISPHELLERFVRGDASRSTEGNGLGLSISQSLMRLQNGELTLDIDGDLFKAVLTLPVLPVLPEAS